MFKWRPILKQVYSVEEYDTHLTLKDVCDANEALDLEYEYEKWNQEKEAKKK